MSNLSFSPAFFQIGTTEELPLSFDFTAYIESGDTVSSPIVELLDLTTGASTPGGLSGSPTATGNVITQTVLGSGLVAGHSYRLVATATLASGKIESGELRIDCVF